MIIEVGWDSFRNSGNVASHPPDPDGEVAVKEFLAVLEGAVERASKKKKGLGSPVISEEITNKSPAFLVNCIKFLERKKAAAKVSGLSFSTSEVKMLKALSAKVEQKTPQNEPAEVPR